MECRFIKHKNGTKAERGRIIGCYRENGTTYLVILGQDAQIHDIPASRVVP